MEICIYMYPFIYAKSKCTYIDVHAHTNIHAPPFSSGQMPPAAREPSGKQRPSLKGRTGAPVAGGGGFPRVSRGGEGERRWLFAAIKLRARKRTARNTPHTKA